MARTTDQMWGDAADADPAAEVSDSPEVASEPVEASEAPEQAAEAEPAAATAAEGDDDGANDPTDFEGFRTALKAARGDGRTFKKQWQEVQDKLEQTEAAHQKVAHEL